MKYNIRDIILESPSGKGEEWLEKQKGIEWSYKINERLASVEQMEKIFLTKKGDSKYFLENFLNLGKSKPLINFMESCTHCGICIDKCHMFISTGDVNNSPVGRAELVRKIYKHPKETNVDISKIYSYYYQCTECRRCAVFCPNGIDQSEITRNVREILTSMGLMPEYLATTLAQVYRVGNNLGLNEKSIANVAAFLEDDLKEETGKEIKIPLNSKADFLLIPSSTDLFVNTDTMKGYAKVLNTLGKSWTISSRTTEAANFGLFASEKYLRDFGDAVVKEAVSLGVKTVLWGECGHGWRSANNYVRYELAKKGINLMHIHQFTWKAMERNTIKVDKNKNDDLYTYHDPCNYARGGNLVNEPRQILKNVVREVVEAKFTKEETFCCGAGAGLLADEKEWNEFRAWAGWPAVYFSWKTNAHYMVSPCAIDKAQFPFVISFHKVPLLHKGLMDLVSNAIEI
ncbi:MAG: (Fe-S)-binding protein [Thermoplasmata archaeon]